MMTFLELVKKRTSVRQYGSQSVSREILDRCLEAARLAPSACNSQPWSFIVVDDPELKAKVAEAAFSGMYSMNAFAKAAPVLVVVVRESSTKMATIGGLMRGTQYNLVDVGIVCEHFALQAAEDGVGTCWLGWFNERAVKNILGVPRHQKAEIILSMGYAADARDREQKRKPKNEMSRYNLA